MTSDHKRINSIVKKIRSCNYTFIDEAIEDLINLEDADPSISQNQVNNNYNFSFGINYNFQKKSP